jgi:hypothetical protein
MPKTFWQFFSKFTMHLPDYAIIAQKMLYMEGFGNDADTLCGPFDKLMGSMAASFSK